MRIPDMAASTSLISIHAPHEGERRKQKALWYWHHAISIHAPHEGERRSFLHHQTAFMNFNPRSPRGGATYGVTRDDGAFGISIHAPHEGERPLPPSMHIAASTYFNPRSPRGGATLATICRAISASLISIHAPHEGERLTPYQPAPPVDIFQSTLPTRGSDGDWWWIASWTYYNFNPRSPRGGATVSPFAKCSYNVISIHAPHEGERLSICPQACTPTAKFQSTLPTRGSDHRHEKTAPLGIHFNPRSPRGGATFKP